MKASSASVLLLLLALFAFIIEGKEEKNVRASSFGATVAGDSDKFTQGQDSQGCNEEDEHRCGDLIEYLPGAPQHDFKQFAGYVTVNEDHRRRLFYWFFHAESDHCRKPLTLWLNGGPGCSSIAGGALSELGPFFPSKDGQHLIYNKHSWIKESNIIFLESPAGVGFSYSEQSNDYRTGDNQTAVDTRAFLLGWFEKFPHFKGRPFYVAGESYAGHYIVDLAKLLWDTRATDSHAINFKGFLLGNPWTVTSSDFRGFGDFCWSRAMISGQTYREFQAECSPREWIKEDQNDKCTKVLEQVDKESGNINPYDIYVDVCTSGPSGEISTFLKKRGHPLSKRSLKSAANGTLKADYDPCIDNEVEQYLNQQNVQEAIHAHRLPYRWQGCSDIIQYSVDDFVSSKFHIWEELLNTPLKITVFSGDVDSVCPSVGTRDWISRLEDETSLKLSHKWTPWYHGKQVGGHFEEYNDRRFRFVTVRNAGHMVPYTQPGRALALFHSFIHDIPLPHCDQDNCDQNENNCDEGLDCWVEQATSEAASSSSQETRVDKSAKTVSAF